MTKGNKQGTVAILVSLVLLAVIGLFSQSQPTVTLQELKDQYIVLTINYQKLTDQFNAVAVENTKLKADIAKLPKSAAVDSLRKSYQIEPVKEEKKNK
jgi:hypothetical protein